MTELWEGQYKFGDFVFGAGTQCVVSSFEQTGYSVSAGDYAAPMTDEVRFRKDYFQPATILMTVSAMENFMIDALYEGGEYLTFPSSSELMEDFMREWRADEVRNIWGYVKPLTYRRLGQVRRIYGRPRDIAAPARRKGTGWYDMVCSYQRADTFSYSESMDGFGVLAPNVWKSISRPAKQAPTWFEIYLVGPIVLPVIEIGPYRIQLQIVVAAGETVQISSYPWARRAVSSNGQNIASKMIGTSPYLSDFKFPSGASWNVKYSGTATDSQTNLAVAWRDAYHSM